MSFLSGVADFGRSALGYLTGDSYGANLVRTAGLAYAVNRLSSNAIKSNNSGTKNIDRGVRLQISPDSDSKIPVLYGQSYFGGNIFDAKMSADNKTMWYALALSEKTGTPLSGGGSSSYTFNDVYRNNQRIVFKADGITADYAADVNGNFDRSIDGLFKFYLYAGGSTNGQVPQGYTGTVPDAYTIFPDWTVGTHPANDLIFAIVEVSYNREKNVTGLGDMLFQVTNSMNQPGDVVYDYLTSTVYGLGIDPSEIDINSLTELNTYSSNNVSYNDEGFGAQTLPNRYQINGLVDTEENVLDNAENLCSAAASWLTYDTRDGKWGVVINRAVSSVASFNDSNILSNVSVGGTGLTDLYNSVKVEFPHRDLRDSADYVKIEIPANERNANEPNNTLVITYDNINEPVQAELLGFIELKQSRVNLTVEFEVDYSSYGLKAGDVIDLTNDRLSFASKPFRIISITEQTKGDGAMSFSISALEYDADVYSVINITRFTRSNEDGIITIGSIGEPSIPQVTKFETDSRPRVHLESLSPTGVVEAMEFWLSNDVNQAEASRSYTLLTTRRPSTSDTFANGTNVIAEVDSLSTQEFVIKSRGVNAVTTGPFSDPSVTVDYTPQQRTDAIGPDTSALDDQGNLATALGVITLLNNLDNIYQGLTGSESLFDVLFDKFQETTGVDIVDFFGGNQGSYALSVNPKLLQPGGNVVVSLLTNNVADGTQVPYTISGVNSFEISGASLTGNFTVTNNTATLLIDSDGSIADGTVMTISLDNQDATIDVTFSDTALSYDIATFDEGTEIEETTKSYNFVGDGVEATNDGSGNITVTYGGGSLETYDEGNQVDLSTTSYNFVGENVEATTDSNGNVTVTLTPTLVPSDDLIPLTPLGSPIFEPTINTTPCDNGSQLPPAFYIGSLPTSDYKDPEYVPGNVNNCVSYSGSFGPALYFNDSTWEGIIERKLFVTG
jgi:hypothetical protein